MIGKHILLITFSNEPKFVLLHTEKWLQVILCITINSTKHHSFVYTQLNDQTVPFLTILFNFFFHNGSNYCYMSQFIQLNVCHLFAHSLNDQKVLFEQYIRPCQVLPLRVRVNLGAMAIKGYYSFPKALRLEPHHQIVLCHKQGSR